MADHGPKATLPGDHGSLAAEASAASGADPFDPVALAARLREAKVRRTEALARRSAGGPAPPRRPMAAPSAVPAASQHALPAAAPRPLDPRRPDPPPVAVEARPVSKNPAGQRSMPVPILIGALVLGCVTGVIAAAVLATPHMRGWLSGLVSVEAPAPATQAPGPSVILVPPAGRQAPPAVAEIPARMQEAPEPAAAPPPVAAEAGPPQARPAPRLAAVFPDAAPTASPDRLSLPEVATAVSVLVAPPPAAAPAPAPRASAGLGTRVVPAPGLWTQAPDTAPVVGPAGAGAPQVAALAPEQVVPAPTSPPILPGAVEPAPGTLSAPSTLRRLEPQATAAPLPGLRPAVSPPVTPRPRPKPPIREEMARDPTVAEAQVFVYFPRGGEATGAKAVAALRAAGVAGAAALPAGVSVSRANIRYFHATDLVASQRIAKILAAGLEAPAPDARDFTGFRPQPAPGLIEVWLVGDAPAAIVRAAPATPRAAAPQAGAPSAAALRQAALEAERVRLQRQVEDLLADQLRRR